MVVVLDLVEFVTEEDKLAAQGRSVPPLMPYKAAARRCFQVDPALLYADLHACVWGGLTGSGHFSLIESSAQVVRAGTLLSQLEDAHGIFLGTLEMVAALETAQGNQAAYDISRASQRIAGLTLGRAGSDYGLTS